MRADDNISARGIGRVVLWYVGRFVGTLGVLLIVGAFYVLASDDPVTHRVLEFVLALAVAAFLLALGVWIMRRGKRLG